MIEKQSIVEGARVDVPRWLVIVGPLIGFLGIALAMAGSTKGGIAVAALLLLLLSSLRPVLAVVLAMATLVADQAFDAIAEFALSPGRLYMLFALFVGLPAFVRYRQEISQTRVALFLLTAMVIFMGISVIWADERVLSAGYVLKLVVALTIVWYGAALLGTHRNISALMLWTLAGTLLGIGVMWFSGASITGADSDKRIVFEGLGMNAVAIAVGTSVIGGMYIVLDRNKPLWIRLTCIIAFLPCYLFVTRLGTRSVVWGLPFTLTVSALYVYRWQIHKTILLVAAIGCVALGVLYWASTQGFVSGNLQERLLNLSGQDVGTGNIRLSLWQEGMKVFYANPLGVGAGNEQLAFLRLGAGTSHALEAHNTYVSTLIQGSIPAFASLVAAVIYLGYRTMRAPHSHAKFVLVALYLFFIVQTMKGSMLQTRIFWLPLFMMFPLLELASRLRRGNQIQSCT